jgi:hypothetical protein
MDVAFLTPFAAFFALAALAPVAAFAVRRRALSRARAALGLTEPSRASLLPLAAALAAIPALLGLAATQPVIETTRVVPERTDTQAFVVVDVSRSMLASGSPSASTRFERAREAAIELRESLPEIPFGVVTLTDRVLPHLFPTTDASVFAATLDDAVGIERPPPGATYLTAATTLDALASVPELNYFAPAAEKRVLVVLTDGETRPLEGRLASAFEGERQIETVFVHVWAEDERIYETGVAEGGYEPDPASSTALAEAASQIGGRVLAEADAVRAPDAVRAAIGAGETTDVPHETGRLALMPWLTLAALLPLVVVLARRNAWWSGARPRLPRTARAGDAPAGAKVSEPRGVAQPG